MNPAANQWEDLDKLGSRRRFRMGTEIHYQAQKLYRRLEPEIHLSQEGLPLLAVGFSTGQCAEKLIEYADHVRFER